MINLKTDKVLESSVPIPLLVRADEVIEQATLLRRVSLVLCPFETCRMRQAMSEFEGEAENICSRCDFLILDPSATWRVWDFCSPNRPLNLLPKVANPRCDYFAA